MALVMSLYLRIGLVIKASNGKDGVFGGETVKKAKLRGSYTVKKGRIGDSMAV